MVMNSWMTSSYHRSYHGYGYGWMVPRYHGTATAALEELVRRHAFEQVEREHDPSGGAQAGGGVVVGVELCPS